MFRVGCNSQRHPTCQRDSQQRTNPMQYLCMPVRPESPLFCHKPHWTSRASRSVCAAVACLGAAIPNCSACECMRSGASSRAQYVEPANSWYLLISFMPLFPSTSIHNSISIILVFRCDFFNFHAIFLAPAPCSHHLLTLPFPFSLLGESRILLSSAKVQSTDALILLIR